MLLSFGWRMVVVLAGLWAAAFLQSITGADLPVYFTANIPPQPDPAAVTPMERTLLDQIDSAAFTIDAALYEFDRPSLRNALLAAHARGVQVRGLLDAGSADDSDSDDEALCAGGVSLKIEGTLGRMHNKFMLIDPGTQRERVITGSLNWTPAGRTSSSENTLVLHDPSAMQAYGQAFATLWALASPQSECNVAPPPAPSAWVYLPAALRQ